MRRTYRGWLPLLCLLALCVACSSESPTSETQAAIQQFYDHLDAENYTAAMGMYATEVREALEVSGGQVDQGYIEWAKEETKMGRVDRIEIVEETVETDTAEVKYQVIYADGSKSNRAVSLTRENGLWRLGYIDNV